MRAFRDPDEPRYGDEAVDDRTMAESQADRLVEQARCRRSEPLRGREALAAWLLAGSFVGVAISLPLVAGAGHLPPTAAIAGVVAAFVVASRVEFEIGSGVALATELAFVPLALTFPPAWGPAVVALAWLVADVCRRDGLHRMRRAPVLVGSCWFAVGPAIVLAAANERGGSVPSWLVLAAAFLAQIGCDAAASAAGEWIAFGMRPLALAPYLGWTYAVDAMLAPAGLVVAYAALHWAAAALATIPLLALLATFARERRRGFDQALELGHAYRETALLLGELIEADDDYTGRHSREVVDLAVAVADELHLDEDTRSNVEIAALLHDVGKIRIPGEIIGKAGPLSSGERAIINTHTIEGERMVCRIGGRLARVGGLIRSSHERWDGNGYPDGLAGEAIPIGARIIAVCDAFNAMTTDRPYRSRRPTADALRELRACAGAQFDAAVVVALEVVATRRGADEPARARAA